MLSTDAQYRFYAQDTAKSAQRVAAEPVVRRESAYYQANIGKVKSVDDFIGNARLYTYAMKANGLEDSIQNRGFMRRVLTSDLTDRKSFVNTLTDPRYKAFALSFSFAADGKVASTASAENADQEDETLGLYSRQTLVGSTQSSDIDDYKAHVGDVTSVDALIGNGRLYRIALQAYGIDPATTSADTIRQVLESDPSNPNSFANSSGHGTDAAQSAADTQSTVSRYLAATGSDAASQAQATVETVYYRTAMPGITSVDAFLSDDRLVAYATQAYGIGTDSPAILQLAQANGAKPGAAPSAQQISDILRGVLTSDLSNPASLANRLGDPFKAAAAGFAFGATAIQSPADTSDTIARYRQGVASDAASQTAGAAETAYYAATIPKVKTADQFVADPRLVAYAVQAYGLTFPAGTSASKRQAMLQSALVSDPTDPQGAAVALGSAFVAFAEAFGSARATYAQGADAAESTVDLYGQAMGQTQATATETRYYLSTMPGVKTVDALVGDSRLSAYVATAYHIAFPSGATDAWKQAQLKSILTEGPDKAGTQFGDGARRLASAFRFDAQGVARQGMNAVAASGAGLSVQTASALQGTVDLYAERIGPDPLAQAKGTGETAYYRSAVAEAGTVDDLAADQRVVSYLATAYGITFPGAASDADKSRQLRAILTSDASDPKSVASQAGDPARQLAAAFGFGGAYTGDQTITQNGAPAYAKLAAAFNFDRNGQVTDPRVAQSAEDAQLTMSAYSKHAGGTANARAQADIAYYSAAIGQVRTVSGFLSDPRLVAVATGAYGIARDPKMSDAQWAARLEAVLTSDVSDPKSAASTLGSAYRSLAAAYDFAADGTITRDPAQQAQSKKAAVLAADPYGQQVMQDEAGTQNKGVQMALYFQQKAPTITSVYQILADKTLLSVVETAFNLPTSLSKLDIDAQARVISDKLKLSDLQDPKKLNSLVQRYTIFYDVDAHQSTAPTSALGLTASGVTASSTSILGLFNPAPPAADTSSMPILQLFSQTA